MKVEIGKSYKIISLCGVAKEHGNCLGNIIKCTDKNYYGDYVWFDKLSWGDSISDTGEYVLAMSDEGIELFGDNYGDFLNNVLEEVK